MEEEKHLIDLEPLTLEDYQELKKLMISSYDTIDDPYWEKYQIKRLIDKFPEGQVVIKVNNVIAGCVLSIIIDEEHFEEHHTYKQVTGNYTFNTHNPKGTILYGIDIFIKPEFRGMRLGRRLYDYRKELCEKLNLKSIIFGGRMPNYYEHQGKMNPRKYLEKVRSRELFDPVLNFQMANDFHPIRVLRGYLEGDNASNEYAVLMEWDNIYYEKPNEHFRLAKRIIKIGLVQWQMRPYANLNELLQQAEFFVDALSSYRCDFALFPEFFNAPLMASFNHLSESEAIRQLAEFTDDIQQNFAHLSIKYNINIITGSMPILENGNLLNVGYVCHRDGSLDRFEKLHVTPDEAKVWGMKGGNHLKTIETDCGNIGVLICYDVEFPELGRLLAEDGLDILFVPFLTDTQNGYSRVRHCAQARAIENECYVAIAGSVGNLPNVHNMDIQYAQSAVFTPCDFSFPTNGLKAEATPNSEMILIVDVDLDLLKELHNHGAVKNLKDRRLDLFKLNRKASLNRPED